MARSRKLHVPDGQRGVALIMVILVLLVLTVLGMTAAMLMTQEDRISSRQDLQKAAMYAAEAGLRQGEHVFDNTSYSNPSNLTPFLAHPASAVITAAAPDPVPVQPAPWDIHHLGTYLTTVAGGATEEVNQEVTQIVGGGASTFNRIRAYYSLYVRNNPEDRDLATGLPTPLVNFDSRLRLVSVGFITDSNGVAADGTARVLAVKILEEEYNWEGAGNMMNAGKDVNEGGTNSGMTSGQTEGNSGSTSTSAP
jgi:Tfp pilus assembly protein PilX